MSCYRLTKMWHHDSMEWEAPLEHLDAMLCFGTRFGTLTLRCLCHHCEVRIEQDYFFTNDDFDNVRALLDLRPLGKGLSSRLPMEADGLFERHTSCAMSDEHILNRLVDAEENFTVPHFFGVLHTTVRLRTAFRKLYFRCFRKAFSPGGRQGCQAIAALAAVLPGVSVTPRREMSATPSKPCVACS